MTMRARTSLAALAFGVAVAALAACSLLAPSDEEAMRGLASGNGVDGSTVGPDGSGAPADGAAADAGPSFPACDASACFACNDGVCAGCRLNGAPCADGRQCCGGVCTLGFCADTAACVPATGGCASASECCTDLACVVVGSIHQCLACFQPGASCANAADCCSRVCTNGTCGACQDLTASCRNSSECCGGNCDKGHCR
jgi:hypothetical protein